MRCTAKQRQKDSRVIPDVSIRSCSPWTSLLKSRESPAHFSLRRQAPPRTQWIAWPRMAVGSRRRETLSRLWLCRWIAAFAMLEVATARFRAALKDPPHPRAAITTVAPELRASSVQTASSIVRTATRHAVPHARCRCSRRVRRSDARRTPGVTNMSQHSHEPAAAADDRGLLAQPYRPRLHHLRGRGRRLPALQPHGACLPVAALRADPLFAPSCTSSCTAGTVVTAAMRASGHEPDRRVRLLAARRWQCRALHRLRLQLRPSAQWAGLAQLRRFLGLHRGPLCRDVRLPPDHLSPRRLASDALARSELVQPRQRPSARDGRRAGHQPAFRTIPPAQHGPHSCGLLADRGGLAGALPGRAARHACDHGPICAASGIRNTRASS